VCPTIYISSSSKYQVHPTKYPYNNLTMLEQSFIMGHLLGELRVLLSGCSLTPNGSKVDLFGVTLEGRMVHGIMMGLLEKSRKNTSKN